MGQNEKVHRPVFWQDTVIGWLSGAEVDPTTPWVWLAARLPSILGPPFVPYSPVTLITLRFVPLVEALMVENRDDIRLLRHVTGFEPEDCYFEMISGPRSSEDAAPRW